MAPLSSMGSFDGLNSSRRLHNVEEAERKRIEEEKRRAEEEKRREEEAKRLTEEMVSLDSTNLVADDLNCFVTFIARRVAACRSNGAERLVCYQRQNC